MKIKSLFILTLFLLCGRSSLAQQALVSSGKDANGANGSVNYSVGQIAYGTFSGTNGMVHQGVQQPVEIFTLGTDNFPNMKLFVVYPNPTSSQIILQWDSVMLENVKYLLFDLNGREVASQFIRSSETQISLVSLPPAIYFLKIMEEGALLKTFKIIKN